jgi:hypothetical protein
MRATTADAYRLLHEGVTALSRVEEAGMRVDVKKMDRMIKRAGEDIKRIEADLKKMELWVNGESDLVNDRRWVVDSNWVRYFSIRKIKNSSERKKGASKLMKNNWPLLMIRSLISFYRWRN